VLVTGDKIEAIGSGVPLARSEAAMDVIDAGGGTIMPGLVDAHVHVSDWLLGKQEEAGSPQDSRMMPWVEAGFTTLRDLGTAPGLLPSVKATVDGLVAQGRASPVVWAGPIVTDVGGYPLPVPAYAAAAQEVESVEQARLIVTELADGGAQVIKMALEKGYYSDLGWPLIELETARAIVEAAHSRGLRVSAHVTSVDELTLALDAGVDDLAHAPLERIPEEVMVRMADQGVGMTTTATVWGGPGAPASAAENAVRYAALGGVVAIGTDFGCCDQTPGVEPFLEEALFLARSGMEPGEIILAATRNGAMLAGRGDQTGTIEAGKQADIIVVPGNPLEDLRALRSPALVMVKGEVVSRR
jgi:imidazolonepropionase-like amidohydrolase